MDKAVDSWRKQRGGGGGGGGELLKLRQGCSRQKLEAAWQTCSCSLENLGPAGTEHRHIIGCQAARPRELAHRM